jgi:plastocyanin
MKKLITVAVLALFATPAFADVVEFHIKAGTGGNSWNTSAESIQAKLGDVIRFMNDDSVTHQLHTNGAPCDHGPTMSPATQWDCKVEEKFSARADGPLYDHNYGPRSQVWIEIE